MIIHPYHPLYGKTFDILKVQQVNGIRRYSLCVGDDIRCVPESWTDRCIVQAIQSESEEFIFDVRYLAELVKLLKSIKFYAENPAKLIDSPNN